MDFQAVADCKLFPEGHAVLNFSGTRPPQQVWVRAEIDKLDPLGELRPGLHKVRLQGVVKETAPGGTVRLVGCRVVDDD